MIINTGARTDMAQWYSDWLLERFREGVVLVRNPFYPDTVIRYQLDPAVVDCVVFCSKNYAPILPRLHEITERFNTYFFYTITAYGRDIEPRVPDIEASVETLYALEEQVGKKRIAWRYDPVLLTDAYTAQRHKETFSFLCSKLAGHVDCCIFSFVERYQKLRHNMPELIPFTRESEEEMAKSLGEIARSYGIRLECCVAKSDWSAYGIAQSGCITLEKLGHANNVRFRSLKHAGMRPGCRCIVSHDIGAYDSCPNGCHYCYANQTPELAEERWRRRPGPESPLILGELKDSDRVIDGAQKSFLVDDGRQLSLF